MNEPRCTYVHATNKVISFLLKLCKALPLTCESVVLFLTVPLSPPAIVWLALLSEHLSLHE